MLCSLGALAACGDDGTTTDGSGASGNTGNTGATGGDGGSSGGTGNIGNTGGTGNIGNTGGVGNQGGTGNEGGSPPMCQTGSDCNDNNLCTTDTCPAGTCVNTAVDPNDNDPCTTDTCDPATGIANTPIDPDDMDQCTLDACRGTGVTNQPSVTLFSESFDNNNAGWTLGTEWGIGPAAAGTSNLDPATDASGSVANGVAGVVIGGNYATSPQHPYYYLTSPVFDGTAAQGSVILSFQRWLTSDYPSFVTNVVEVYDGAAWQVVWQQPANGTFIHDAPPQGDGWLHVEYDVTAFANANMQVRFGHKIESGGVIARGGWTLDDVEIINRPTAADNDPCTADSCDSVAGSVYTPIPIDDANACTADSCDADLGISHEAISCDDSNACTTDSCDPATGCINTPVVCNDNNACTTDSCNPATGCVFTPIVCNDNNACTTNSCNPATGCTFPAIVCNDNNACTTNSCNPATGCTFPPIVCNDGNACTVDSCNVATGCTAAVPTQPHDKCVTGAALINTPGCTAGSQGIISAVCAADSFCCNSSWDGLCVNEVFSVGDSKICPASQGSCSHTLCTSGAALVANCDSAFGDCVDNICAPGNDPFCCNTSWDGICVNQVTTDCMHNCL